MEDNRLLLLQNPLDTITVGNAQDVFTAIAENLIKHFGLKCGDKVYCFAEIEFYYYKEGVFNNKWNDVTYKRNGYTVGDLYYHWSGVDICFNCNEKEYGGILIRSIIDEERKVTAGPMCCYMEILNVNKGKCVPELIELKDCNGKADVRPLPRKLGDVAMKEKVDAALELCFYDRNITKEEWMGRRKDYYKQRFTTVNNDKR